MANIFFKNFACLILTPILLLGFFIAPAKAQVANHLVISAAQITEGDGKTGHDFIEIFNPSASDINLKGYRLVKRTKVGVSDASIKSWTDDVFIQAHGWRLWASSDDKVYSLLASADDATTATLAADNGIAIRFGAADTGDIIDSLAWGAAENIFKEGAAPSNPIANESLVRKPGNGVNGEDTNNNAGDFFIAANYAPHNSGGYAPASPVSTPTSTAAPTPSANSGSQNYANGAILKPLVVEAGADKQAAVSQEVSFDGSDSYDPEGKALEYAWDFGDGVKAAGANVLHIFNAIGNFKVSLKITSGARAAEDFLLVKIIEPDFSDKVVLSEILPDPAGADKDGEWIEIYNGGDKKVNLKGWMLDDKTDSGAKPFVFSEDAFVEAKGFLVAGRSKSKIVLANAGGEVNLLWHNGKNLSKVVYGAAKEGWSYALINNVWQWTNSPSAGKENSLIKSESDTQPKKSAVVLPVKAEENIVEVSGEIIKAAKAEQNIKADNSILNKAVLKDTASEEIIAGEAKITNEYFKNTASDNLGNSNSRNNNRSEEKSNPWFWGNMALSAVSLFLVWRYQSLKKRVK